jgi:cytochrome c peroxidase
MKTLKSILAVALVAILFAGIITAQDRSGKDVFVDSKCTTCHPISSLGIESKGKAPDLKDYFTEKKTPEQLKQYLNKETDLGKGKNHPVKFKGTDEDFNQLVGWLSTLGAPQE